MNLMTKEELSKKLGEPSFWSPKRLVDIGEYIASIPDLDDKIGVNNFLKTKPIINFLITLWFARNFQKERLTTYQIEI